MTRPTPPPTFAERSTALGSTGCRPTFRNTVATRLDDAGLSARQIADHLGHAHPSITQDVYMGRNVASTKAAKVLQELQH